MVGASCADSVWVVGGGFTGVASALSLVGAGHTVCLHERDPELGGVLRDDFVAGAPRMRGCHVIQADLSNTVLSPWNLDSHFTEVANDVFSKTWHRGVTMHSRGPEGPLCESDPRQLGLAATNFVNTPELLADRIALYPAADQLLLHEILSNLGIEHQDIYADSVSALQLNRLYPLGPGAHELFAAKAKIPLIDELYGVAPTTPKNVLLPKDGYSSFFSAAGQVMREAGICMHLDEVVDVQVNKGEVVFRNSAGIPSRKGGIWCASPTVLQARLNPLDPLNNLAMRHTRWHVQVQQPAKPYFAYVQYFGHPEHLLRATAYEYKGVQHAVVESLSAHKLQAANRERSVLQAVRDLNLTPVQFESQKRSAAYPLISSQDAAKLKVLEFQLKREKWVHGAWLSVGRTAKVEKILDETAQWALGLWGEAN